MFCSIKRKLAEQAQKPQGWFGRHIISRVFNKKNRDMEQSGLEQMNPAEGDHILEVGFGNGKLISEIASGNRVAKMCGIDISEDMVEMATHRNRKWIERGVVELKKGSVSDLPWPDSTFDKIFTANTIYFWQNPPSDLEEIKRVLKPGGRFYCAVRPKEFMESLPPVRDNRQIYLNLYDEDELKILFEKADFNSVQVQNGSNSILVTAEKG